MLRRALATSLLLALLTLPSYAKTDSPTISYPDFRVDDGNSQLLTQEEEDEIVRFVKTVHGVDHRVQEIEVKSHYQVEVKTGRVNPPVFTKKRQGDQLLLRKSDGQWTVVERSRWSYPASKNEDGVYIWDGTSELAILARVTDAVTHKPISGATVGAVRVGGRNTEPLTNEHPTAMPPPQKTGRDGRVRLVAYFRAAGDAHGFCVFVGDSFLQIDAPEYRSQRVRISPIVKLDFARKIKHCEVGIPVALTHQ